MPQGIDVTLRNRVTTREILAVTRSTAPRSLTVLGKNGKGFRYPQMAARFRLVKYYNVPIFLNIERERKDDERKTSILYML
jgi:GTPase Era involved in 16S rRNA processing